MRWLKWIGMVCATWIALSGGGCSKHTGLEEFVRARDGGEAADASSDESTGTSSARGLTGTAAGGSDLAVGANAAGAMDPPPTAEPSCGECSGFCFFDLCIGGDTGSDDDDGGVPTRPIEPMSSGGAPGPGPGEAQPDDRCGDGAANGTEACDDGNIVAADGCSPTCAIEPGFACTGKLPSVCKDIDACLTAGCAASEICRDSPAPAPDGAAGRTCEPNANGMCGDGMCTGSENAPTCPSDCTRCGDSLCTGNESAMTCAPDCTRCGDGLCTGDESPFNCAGDCGRCGDLQCSGNETLESCPADCARCGDEVCTVPETLLTCPSDCSICGDGVCTEPETRDTCPNDCSICADGQCTGVETLITCPADCGTRCGDDLCTGDETLATCPNDCSICGDGMCTGMENAQSCVVDCPMRMP